MSTCSGCWRDQRVPGGVGVLTTSGGVLFVVHDVSPACSTKQPHHADACGEFEPVRPGFTPDVDGPDKAILWLYDWDSIFARLDAGESMFQILGEHSSAATGADRMLSEATA